MKLKILIFVFSILLVACDSNKKLQPVQHPDQQETQEMVDSTEAQLDVPEGDPTFTEEGVVDSPEMEVPAEEIVDEDADPQILFGEWSQEYLIEKSLDHPTVEDLDRDQSVLYHTIRSLNVWTSLRPTDEEAEQIRDQLVEVVQPTDMDFTGENLCDPVEDTKGRDFDIFVILESLVNSKTQIVVTTLTIQWGDLIDGVWLSKEIEGSPFRIEIKCSFQCDVINLMVFRQFSNLSRSAYFQLERHPLSRFQWDQAQIVQSSMELGRLRQNTEVPLPPSQCRDESRGKIIIEDFIDRRIQVFNQSESLSDYVSDEIDNLNQTRSELWDSFVDIVFDSDEE